MVPNLTFYGCKFNDPRAAPAPSRSTSQWADSWASPLCPATPLLRSDSPMSVAKWQGYDKTCHWRNQPPSSSGWLGLAYRVVEVKGQTPKSSTCHPWGHRLPNNDVEDYQKPRFLLANYLRRVESVRAPSLPIKKSNDSAPHDIKPEEKQVEMTLARAWTALARFSLWTMGTT